VSRDRIVDCLWGERPPASAAHAVEVHVSRLRRTVAPARIEREGAGYRLRVDAADLDAAVFERLVGEGRARLAEGDAAVAARELRAALALWRGPALADVAYEDFAQAEIARLEELRLGAVEDAVEAELVDGGKWRWSGQQEAGAG
jgi:DNA-binding SARP family transcriptional activator